MRISDWSSDVCSSDLERRGHCRRADPAVRAGGRPTRGEACLLPRCYELGKAFRACREMRCAMIECDLGIARIGAAGREAAADSAGFVKECRLEPGVAQDRKSTRLNSRHQCAYRMPSSA